MTQAEHLISWLKRSMARRRGLEPDVSVAVHNLLAVFRFVSVATIVALVAVTVSSETVPAAVLVLSTLAVLFSALMVGLRSLLGRNRRTTYALLIVDSSIATSGILAFGGMDSPFLLYALLPILTTALLLNRPLALALAFVPGITVTLAHTVGNIYYQQFPWILEGNYLTLVPIYASVCLGMALLPFYTNLNVRRLEQMAARRTEQRRLQAEIHDKLAQSLSALTLGLRQLRRTAGSPHQMAELGEISERSYAELRELLDLLEAGTWEPTAVETLDHLVQAWAQETGIPVSSNLPHGDLELPPEVAIALLGIAREALTNASKHSGANHVWLYLHADGEGTVLSVRDNGRGFSSAQSPGHGLRIMRERAQEIGAALTIESAPNGGTEVQVRYPPRR